MTMKSEHVEVEEHSSRQTEMGSLILSAKQIDLGSKPRKVDLVVSRVGFPSLSRTLTVDDAVLFDTAEGVFEIRVLSLQSLTKAVFCINPLPQRLGPTAGVVNEDTSNLGFTEPELHRIRKSLAEVRDAVGHREDLMPEQVDYISRKLDYIADAANRVGRKDWINLAIGTLTNLFVSGAVGPDPAKFLVQILGQALDWMLGGNLKLLH